MADILVGSKATVQGTGGDDIFKDERADVWIIGGQHTLAGGTGHDAYFITSNTTVVELPGEGYDTIVSANSYKLPDNVEVLYVWGGWSAVGNDLDNEIFGGGAANFFNGGKGNDKFTGAGGADTFQFDAKSGNDTILDWNSADRIRLGGYSQFSDLDDVKGAMTQVGSNVVIKLDASNSITVNNTSIADFKATNFEYVVNLANYDLKQSFFDDFNTFSVHVPTQGLTGTWDLWGAGNNAVTAHTLQSNGERQLYVDPSFAGTGGKALGLNPYSIEDGKLVITAAPIAADIKSSVYNYDYSSGAVTTNGTFAQTYGYFEARMQLPSETGSWPAFWLMRQDGVWPPEMDILEAWNDTTAVQTLHTSQFNRHETTTSSTWVWDGDTAFHTYGLLWTPDTLTWTIDGVEVFSRPTPADMHQPMYMILNLAISGAVTDPNFNEQLKIDYVRAYAFDEVPQSASAQATMGKVDTMPDGFNVTYYMKANPDVAASGRDPLWHYEHFGKQEGRLPYEGATVVKLPVDLFMGKVEGMPDGFNADYYEKQNPDVVAASFDPLVHYLRHGKAEGRLPYDPTDIATAGHDVYLGARPDQPYGFNLSYYAMKNPDVVAANVDLLQHYEQYGKFEGRLPYDPTISVDTLTGGTPVVTTPDAPVVAPVVTAPPVVTTPPVTTAPVVTTPVVTTPIVNTPAPTPPAVITPVVNTPAPTPTPTPPVTPAAAPSSTAPHVYWGAADTVHDGFNLAYYTSHNPDVVAAGVNPLQHYLQYGKAEGRLAYDPTDTTPHGYWGKVTSSVDGFNADYYLTHNPDVALAQVDPLQHYLQFGKTEGRQPYDASVPVQADAGAPAAAAQTFDAAYYALHNPDVVAAGIDLKTHYDRFGKAEGRLGFDDGSGKESIVGTAGNDVLVAPTGGAYRVLTGGEGNDTFKFAPGIGWDTVTDFEVGHDKLDASALVAAYGAPTISDLSWASGSMVHFAGGENIVLLGVTAAQAQLVVMG